MSILSQVSLLKREREKKTNHVLELKKKNLHRLGQCGLPLNLSCGISSKPFKTLQADKVYILLLPVQQNVSAVSTLDGH